MSYQILVREWRPRAFADVVGQEHVLTVLTSGLSLECVHHAYLSSGTHGVGKTSIVRLLAEGLNCETGITATPYGVYDNCHEIEQGRFVNLIEIDAALRTKVGDTHDPLDNVQYASARDRFKVYLIGEVHILLCHNLNTLLKALEEPPRHVKFLLATTDPQKLPVTILSCCLRPHLKALDVEQIRHQLEHILNEGHITREPWALQLLARAAEGSLRGALSLTDQTIANDDSQVSTQAVSAMSGTLGGDQVLSLVEAMAEANGEYIVALINEATAHGAEWEALLVGMLGLLHRITMARLSLIALGNDMAAIRLRMHELARTVPPTDIQPYYQAPLIGHKELPYAPDHRTGVGMMLLRALAFHPRVPLPEPEVPHQLFAPVASMAVITPTQVPPQPQSALRQAPTIPLSETISQVLATRQQLQRVWGVAKAKRGEPVTATRVRSANNTALERLALVTDRAQARPVPPALGRASVKKEAYRWRATTPAMQQKEVVVIPKALKKALEREEVPELAAKLAAETIEHDLWAAQVSQLSLPELIEQMALNAWKEKSDNAVYLYLRSSQRHLNNHGAQQKPAEALSMLKGSTVELTIVEDDNPVVRTPLEWRQAIYEEELAQAYESIIADNSIQTLRRFFDAELDEESIRPI